MHLRPPFRGDQSNIIWLFRFSHYSYYFIRSLAIRIRRIALYVNNLGSERFKQIFRSHRAKFKTNSRSQTTCTRAESARSGLKNMSLLEQFGRKISCWSAGVLFLQQRKLTTNFKSLSFPHNFWDEKHEKLEK